MSIKTIAAEAVRVGILSWRGDDGLRNKLVTHIYGPQHPGFVGKPRQVDPHILLLLACARGEHGRALQVGLLAYHQFQLASARLAALTAKRRRDRSEERFAASDVEQWGAIFRAARMIYLGARAVRGEQDLGVLPGGPFEMGVEPWTIPKPLPVTTDLRTLVTASHNAVALAKHAADSAPRREEIVVPGMSYGPNGPTHQQMLVNELGRFAAKLEIQFTEGVHA